VVGQVQADGGLQCSVLRVAAAANLLVSQLGEPAFHLIDPGRVGGREAEVEARVSEVYPKPVDQSWSEERGVPFWLLRTRDG
jgi:hypothetical protein